ncbi:16833_t:CDS:2 [Cetraspora pellucida]|uniref:16833_t:CDS:1 n=1 Tax=Cetraspora pellucida TaxID=1433469 RepID=A0A9N9D4B4_9GLOM|nr:16833_t:CDS:2 [Cetraspora pellucida]
MPRVKNKKDNKTVYNKTSSKKKVNLSSCIIKYCFDEEKLNNCKVAKPAGIQIITEVFGPITENNKTFFVEPLYTRIFPLRLYQTKTNFASFEHIILHNISIYINFVILQSKNHTQTIEILTTENKNSKITLLIFLLKIKSFILQLCDKDLACKKSSNILISDLLVDKNLCKKYNLNTLNSGISEFMADGYIEMTWSPHLRDVDFNRIMSQIGYCCDNSDVNVDGFEASEPNDDGRLYYKSIDERYTYIRITDIVNIQTNSTQTEVLTPVISNKLKLKFYFLEICDKEIAKQNNSPIGDVFLNRDLCNIQFREYFNFVIEFEYDIKYKECQYEPHDFVFCLDLEKTKVCQLDNNDLIVAKIFNIENYAFVFVIDYFN